MNEIEEHLADSHRCTNGKGQKRYKLRQEGKIPDLERYSLDDCIKNAGID